MSFASDCKNEIIGMTVKNTCCRRAFINGIIISKARLIDSAVTVSLENDAYCNHTAKFVSEFFGRTAEIASAKTGGRCRLLTFDSRSAKRYVDAVEGGAPFFDECCEGCLGSFLRGVFFASGRVTVPNGKGTYYSLDLSPIRHQERILGLILDAGLELRTTTRRSELILYQKKSGCIEEFLTLIGLNNAVFAIMNKKIATEVAMSQHRITNCEINNINKTVTASQRYKVAIQKIERAGLLSSLPEELEMTARARLKNDSLSLHQLAATMTPPISKSGLLHRLNKIVEFSESIGKNRKK